mgnify:CR=1 FL=1
MKQLAAQFPLQRLPQIGGLDRQPVQRIGARAVALDLDATTVSLSGAGYTGRGLSHAQCLLRKKKHYSGEITGVYDAPTAAAVRSRRGSRARQEDA